MDSYLVSLLPAPPPPDGEMPPDVEYSSDAAAINNDGTVVGKSLIMTTLGLRTLALVWRPAPSLLPCPDPAGVIAGSGASGINDAGDIVGSWSKEYDPTPLGGALNRSFLYRDSTMYDLTGPLNAVSSSARAINNKGWVVGDYATAAFNGEHHAFLYNVHDQQLIDIGVLPGFPWAQGVAVNGMGHAVGTCNSMSSQPHAFLYHLEHGGLSDVGEVQMVADINDSGQIVGARAFGGPGILTAFLCETRKLKYSFMNLGTLPLRGYDCSAAAAVNAQGDIVGTSYPSGHPAFARAFLRPASGPQQAKMLDLNSFIAKNSGWVLQAAHDINDDGQIVGHGTFNGQVRAFRLTPVAQVLRHLGDLTGIMKYETAIDPLALVLSGDVYIKLHTPDPGPEGFVGLGARIRELVQNLGPTDRARATARAEALQRFVQAVQEELERTDEKLAGRETRSPVTNRIGALVS